WLTFSYLEYRICLKSRDLGESQDESDVKNRRMWDLHGADNCSSPTCLIVCVSQHHENEGGSPGSLIIVVSYGAHSDAHFTGVKEKNEHDLHIVAVLP
ncbi:hypothetical protein NPIL_233281, partial [Nephila pilipes]